MTIQQAEIILQQVGINVALHHRFAFDTGTILRLENYAIINIFDDGRYFIQGEDTAALIAAFNQAETAWNPDAWTGEVPRQALPALLPQPNPVIRSDS